MAKKDHREEEVVKMDRTRPPQLASSSPLSMNRADVRVYRDTTESHGVIIEAENSENRVRIRLSRAEAAEIIADIQYLLGYESPAPVRDSDEDPTGAQEFQEMRK